MKTIKEIQKNYPNIAIGHPLDWNETAQKCRMNGEANKKRLYAFSTYANGFWHEPAHYYYSLGQLVDAIQEEEDYQESIND
jgi:hypothetical protein